LKNNTDITREEIARLLAGEEETATPSEIDATEEALLQFSGEFELQPPAFLKNKVLDKLKMLGKQQSNRSKLDLSNLPVLSPASNWFDWKEAVKGIEPPDDYENIHLHTLELNDNRELFIAWVREMVPQEVHHNLLESFLILEGSCECEITDTEGKTRMVRLSEGDFITMQLGESHNIIITSPTPTKAILQWLKVA